MRNGAVIRRDRLRQGALALALGAMVIATAHAQTSPPAPQAKPAARPAAKAPAVGIEPRAVEILKAASARLAAARTMAFTATVTYEYPSLAGPPIAITTRSLVAMQRPDRLVVVTPGDGPPSEIYYDGKTLMGFAPQQNLVAVAQVSGGVERALRFLFDTSATYLPFTDLLIDDPYAALADGLKLAFYIGRSEQVGGVPTDLIAFSNGDIFMQAWIGAEDRLPRRIRATYARDPLQLRHQLDLSDWVLDAPVAPERFGSAKAAAANRIAFGAPVYKVPPGGVKPLRPAPAPKPAAKPAAQ
jgi:hypothetical protein